MSRARQAALIKAAGGDPAAAKTAVEVELARQPKVQGGGAGQPQATPDLVRVLDNAQSSAGKAGDSFVAQDRLLVALAASDGPAANALRQANAPAQALERAVEEIRKGRKVDQRECRGRFRRLEEIRPRRDRGGP